MSNLTKQLIKEIFQEFSEKEENFLTLVETGTHLGKTCINLHDVFKRIYTMEISEKYFHLSCLNFQRLGIKNVDAFLGDSSKILPQLLQILNENLFFWLDGHWSMGDTGRGEKDSPLLEEIQSIVEYCKNKKTKSIIVIDDVRIFGKQGWEDISFESVRSIAGNFIIKDYVKDDIFCLLVDGNL